jgi:hypothetical protein
MAMTAKTYIDGLTWQEFEVIKVFKDASPDFYKFLAEPCTDVMTVANFAIQCQNAGIPEAFTRSAESLHYLVVAINARACGNA